MTIMLIVIIITIILGVSIGSYLKLSITEKYFKNKNIWICHASNLFIYVFSFNESIIA